MTHEHSYASAFITSIFGFVFAHIHLFFTQIQVPSIVVSFAIIILNSFVGATVGFFTMKLWNGEAYAWYKRQRFTLEIRNIWKAKKYSFFGFVLLVLLAYWVQTGKSTFADVSLLFVAIVYFLLFGKKPFDNEKLPS